MIDDGDEEIENRAVVSVVKQCSTQLADDSIL